MVIHQRRGRIRLLFEDVDDDDGGGSDNDDVEDYNDYEVVYVSNCDVYDGNNLQLKTMMMIYSMVTHVE